jgi:hypothetical protein
MPHEIQEFKTRQETLLSRLAKWNTAFSLFRAYNACTSTPTASLLLLQILYHTAIIWTSTAMSEAEQVFDEYIEHFSAIIPLCAAYLEAIMQSHETVKKDIPRENGHFKPGDSLRNATKPVEESHRKVMFSFETGMVPALFLTAAKCRHPHIRRAALALLSRDEERQENLWKAKVFARIAAHMVHIETEAGKKFRQEQVQLPLSPLTIPSCSTPQEDPYNAPFEATQGCQPAFDAGVRARVSQPETPAKFPKTSAVDHQSTPDSCRSLQYNRDIALASENDNCNGPFGIPEHLRISGAIIGQHERTGINVTLFRKPSPFCEEWQIWNEFIQVD